MRSRSQRGVSRRSRRFSSPRNEPTRRGRRAFRSCRVGPLDREAATQVRSVHTGRIAPDVLGRILDAALGNPLALVELPHLLPPGQLAGTDALADLIPTANGLERAFAVRLQPLTAAGRLATVVAAADSSGTAAVVLAAFGSLGLAEHDLGEVESLGLLHVDANQLEFRHPLVRSAAYHGADAAERRRVHAALADVDPDPDRPAWHLAAATLGTDDVIADELDRAGARALARGGIRRRSDRPRTRRFVDGRRRESWSSAPARGQRNGRRGKPRAKPGARRRGGAPDRRSAPPRATRPPARPPPNGGRGRRGGLRDAPERGGARERARSGARGGTAQLLALTFPFFRVEGNAAVELTERAWEAWRPYPDADAG